ncbi:MAG: energy transducer TonB [Deltaproteobacteria bacterium]|nr:energy transducer TonB [Deltaproteobacteria bacterium]
MDIYKNRLWGFVAFSLLLHLSLIGLLGWKDSNTLPQGSHGNGGEGLSYLLLGEEEGTSEFHDVTLSQQPLQRFLSVSPEAQHLGASTASSLSHGISGKPGDPLGDPYLTEVYDRINAAFVYPRLSWRRGEEGTVRLELTLGEEGRLLELKLLQSSGHESLDQAALQATEKAAPFPVPPTRYANTPHTISFVVSIR